MKNRPKSIAAIAWILIVTSVYSVFMFFFMRNNPDMLKTLELNPIPIPVQYFMMYLGSVVSLVSGIGMLKGINWSRYLYAVYTGINFLITFFTFPSKIMLLPSMVFVIIIMYFLFSKNANQYFKAKRGVIDPQSH